MDTQTDNLTCVSVVRLPLFEPIGTLAGSETLLLGLPQLYSQAHIHKSFFNTINKKKAPKTILSFVKVQTHAHTSTSQPQLHSSPSPIVVNRPDGKQQRIIYVARYD